MQNIPTPHISAKKSDFAKTILMPGDPLRSKYIAENFLTDAKLVNNVRGIQGYTGYYKGKKVSVMAHGMGMPSASIYAQELFEFYGVNNIIRIGTAGALTKDLKVRDVVLGKFAITPSNIGKRLGVKKNKASASEKLCEIAENCAKELNKTYHLGGIVTSDVFYGQGKMLKYTKKGCIAVEMETYAIYAIAQVLNKNALSIVTIADSLITGENTTSEERQSSFNDMVTLALETAIKLK